MPSKRRNVNEMHERMLACLVYNGGEITDPNGFAMRRLRRLMVGNYSQQQVSRAVANLEHQGFVVRDNRARSGGRTTRMPTGQVITPRGCYGVYLAKERDELGDDLPFYLDELDRLVKQRMIDAAKREYAGDVSPRKRGGRATEKKTETTVIMPRKDGDEEVKFRTAPAATATDEPVPSMDDLFVDTSAAALIADALLERLIAKVTAEEPPMVVEVPVEVDNAVIDGLKHELSNVQAMLKRRDENIDVLSKRVDVLGKENESLRKALLNVRDRGGRLTQSIEQILDPDTKRRMAQMVSERPDQQHKRGPRPPEADRG